LIPIWALGSTLEIKGLSLLTPMFSEMTSVALEGLKNNLNNYKGVMLCTRPNENIGVSKDKPFISRVDPKAQIGINPVKKVQTYVPTKKANPVLLRHRVWLNQFKDKMKDKKLNEECKEQQDREKFERIREQATVQRGMSHELAEETSPAKAVSPVNQQEQVSPHNLVKKQTESKSVAKKKENKEKPKWALTEKQVDDEEELDVDNLLEFTNNLDYEKYIDDLEVKDMVTALKKRIDELHNKDEDDWKNKIVDAWNNDDKKAAKSNKVDISFDARSDARSVASESKSAASEKSNKSISELKAKLESKERKDWDNLSTTTTKKKNAVTVEERIAKHVADEILRNNTEFRHFHSNNSIRKILEKEAKKHIEESKGIRAPEIVSNKEYFSRKDVQDPNNLPYLHRNPAV